MNKHECANQKGIKASLLGCIADDFTGATDLAGILALNGMRTTVTFGIPESTCISNTDAIVIALKSRNVIATDAVTMSLSALRWLRTAGCRQYFFKYCSTFDSIPSGNIGPVAVALMDELGANFTIACPAFPANRRTVYNGYLFVNDGLLEESGMQFHPLNPMTDSNVVRLLQAQTVRKVGLIDYPTVQAGVQSITDAISKARNSGVSVAVVDAVSEANLCDIASSCQDLPLVTGASGLAIGIPETFRRQGLLGPVSGTGVLPPVSGYSAIISGSCSEATQRQVAWMEGRAPTLHLDPLLAGLDPEFSAKAAQWACSQMENGPVLISASANAETVKLAQAKFGTEGAGRLVEDLLADIAQRLVEKGFRRFIVAGGETSGAVLKALGVRSLCVGPQIDPGVHWAISEEKVRLALALKSGNFGSVDFFSKAWSLLS